MGRGGSACPAAWQAAWGWATHGAEVVVTMCVAGPYLEEAPVILDKPDVVYVVEGQPASVTITINHVEATVTWRR